MTDNDQLNELRQQMDDLRRQLDNQEIVNEQLLRKSMTAKMSWIKRYIWFEIALVPLLLIFFAGLHYTLGLSWWLFAFLAVILVVDVVADYRINHVDRNQLLSGNLMEASRKLVRMKKLRATAFIISLVGVIVWVVWMLLEMQRVSGTFTSDHLNGFVVGGIFGGAIGGLIGLAVAYFVFRRMQRTNDEMLHDINQLTDGGFKS